MPSRSETREEKQDRAVKRGDQYFKQSFEDVKADPEKYAEKEAEHECNILYRKESEKNLKESCIESVKLMKFYETWRREM